jgi:hypothetical protein
MTRAALFKTREPDFRTDHLDYDPADPGFFDKIGEVIEDVTNGVCDVIYGVCDVINNLALDITIAGATLAGAKE